MGLTRERFSFDLGQPTQPVSDSEFCFSNLAGLRQRNAVITIPHAKQLGVERLGVEGNLPIGQQKIFLANQMSGELFGQGPVCQSRFAKDHDAGGCFI